MNRVSALGVIASFIVATGTVHAGGKIYQFDENRAIIQVSGSDWISFTSPSDITSAANDLPVTLQTGTRYVDIIPASNSDNIPKLTFTGGPSSGKVQIYLGQEGSATDPDFRDDDFPPAKAGLHLRGIHATGLNGSCESEFYGGITGDFGQNLNPDTYNFTVDRLVRFDATGMIRGNFVIGAPGGTSPAVRIPVYCPRGASLRGRQVGSAV